MKGSFLIQYHGWRGFGRDRGLFWLELRCGLITVAYDGSLVTDAARRLLTLLSKRALRKMRRRR